MKVYALETNEPLYKRFETGMAYAIVLYSTREKAEEDCAEYEESWGEVRMGRGVGG